MYLDTLRGYGIEPLPNAIPAAYVACALLAQGYSPDWIAYQVYLTNDLTPQMSMDLVMIAIATYCPPPAEPAKQQYL